jgi:two-component system cell cycle sensor histidine kinase/response regulator CckA
MDDKLRILILEDMKSDALLLENELKDAKFKFVSKRVVNREDFMTGIETFKPDLVLADYSLPKFDGMSALELVKKESPGTPLIIVTGAINEETAVDCMKAGAVDYVLKDRLGRLGPAVRSAVEKSQAMKEKKSAEEALSASETRYRRLFESAKEGILLLDTETGEIRDVNPFMLELLGVKRNQVLSKTLVNIGVLNDPSLLDDLFDESEEEAYIHHDHLVLKRKDGKEIDIELTCNSYNMDNRKLIQCNVHDVTERKNAEKEKEKIRAQLFQAQKMEAIGTLAGGVAHDFNNLMTAIQVSSDVAMMRLEEDDVLHKDLKEIRLAAMRASGLIRQLLLFSRKHPMEFTSFSLNDSIENLLKMFQRLISENIEIRTDLDPELWSVKADAGNIEQVIMNLALNSRDAMPDGGKLIIKTENKTLTRDTNKQLPESRPGDFVCLSIRDTGIGIDKKIFERIFEPFFTTKGPGKGTGLGLSVVYGIVKEHEGWISMNSTLGEGSEFSVYLPASAGKPEKEVDGKISLQGLTGNKERILLVEDEEKVRESALKALDKCGYSVIPARNAKEALEIFKKEKGNFRLVFSDVVLSDKSGIDLVEEMLKIHSNVQILLTSGYTDHKSQWPLIRDKGFYFLQKPYTLTDLLRSVRTAIDLSQKKRND